MKRGAFILILGGCLALAAYWGAFQLRTAPSRAALDSDAPELMWLKTEFKLSNEEFDRISRLHEAYLPGCAERCARIDEKNAELKRLLASTNTVTAEIEKTIQDAARLRADCQSAMLKHFYEVSRAMPPEQGRRYFEWVKEKTFHMPAHH